MSSISIKHDICLICLSFIVYLLLAYYWLPYEFFFVANIRLMIIISLFCYL